MSAFTRLGQSRLLEPCPREHRSRDALVTAHPDVAISIRSAFAFGDWPPTIEGYVNPDGSGAGDWSAYDGLSPLQARHADGDR